MISYTINFGQTKLAISFGRRRGRPGKNLLARGKEFLVYLLKLAKDKRRAGQPLSRVFRYLLENKKTKRIFGLNLAIMVLFAGVITPPISAFTNNPEGEITTLSASVVNLTTEHSVRVPLDSFVVTQGYSLFHRGVDLNGELGEPVYPIMDGTVETIFSNRFSYGNHLIVDHGSGFKSLYAHLAKIVVKEGEEVDKGTVIGTVGSTGWATGTHLHLEVYDNGRTFNPLTILK
jgi:murein DD-endopeptidase MepM/ murein hydrolase activator NlpD